MSRVVKANGLAMRFVGNQHRKAVATALKPIYTAPTVKRKATGRLVEGRITTNGKTALAQLAMELRPSS